MKSKIAHWFYTWKHPVTAAALENLKAASRAAARALGESGTPSPYTLYSTNLDVRIRQRGAFEPALRLTGILHGQPVEVSLHQRGASGLIGPFARARKAARKQRVSKENAILFWSGQSQDGGKVLKASIGEKGQARETRMLKALAGLDGMVPALLAHDPALRWIVMEKIDTASSLPADQQAECYVSQIAPRYFTFWGCKARPARLCLGEKSTFPEMEKEARYLGLSLPHGWQDGRLDCSITHGGGICEEILLRSDGRACLLDWEKAALAPIAEDLLQVFEYRPQETLALFETLKTAGSLGATDQLALTLCKRSIANRSRKSPIAARLRSDKACAAHLAALGVKTAGRA